MSSSPTTGQSSSSEYSATYTMEFVTPAFLAGADQQTPEIHIPSIRGALRYWLRAAAGGVYGTSEEGLKKVREAEEEVFGSTKHGSPVVITEIEGPAQIESSNERFRFESPPYLFWPMTRSKEEKAQIADEVEKLNYKREYIVPSGQLRVKVRIKVLKYRLTRTALPTTETNLQPLSDDDWREHKAEKILRRLDTAFWLLGNLGSLGARSRRGAGSILISHEAIGELPANMQSFDLPMKAANLEAFLQTGFAGIEREWGHPVSNQTSSFDIVAPNILQMWIFGRRDKNTTQPLTWAKWEDVLREFGAFLKWAHGQIKASRDTKELRDQLFGGVPIHETDLFIFGLPTEGIDSLRRSSPLMFRVLRLGNKYIGLVSLFKSHFGTIIQPQPNYELLARLLNSLSGVLPETAANEAIRGVTAMEVEPWKK